MTVGVGVIGAGVMGSDHARIIREAVSGARLEMVADADAGRAEAAAGGARTTTDPLALIGDASVEAVIVASPDHTHRELTLAAVAAGKPVLCEKPLAPTLGECMEIVAAEGRAGRRLVHAGFMRRFDPAYGEMKAALSGGEMGPLRIVHNIHRNVSAPDWFTADMAVTNSFPHEIDICRWLLGCEFTAATAFRAGPGERPGEPLLIVLEAENGAVVSTEVHIDATYGYHVQCEAVCARGTISLAEPALTRTRIDRAARAPYPENWIPRFAEAYRLQDQAWIDAIGRDAPSDALAGAWDGLMATHIAQQVVMALETGTRVELTVPDRP